MTTHSTDSTPLVNRDPQLLAIAEALAMPFEPNEIKFKPKVVKENRALAMAYIDARLIQDRLDGVLGVENWQDTYETLADGSVICRLKLKLGTRWITKTDVGSQSEQPDSGDRLKAAFSDALKRAAVKFGIGRYLYRLPAQWVDYDPVKKQLLKVPTLPSSALPKPMRPVKEEEKKERRPLERPQTGHPLPSTGQELHRRLVEYDAKLAEQKICSNGALLAHVAQSGQKAGYSINIAEWAGPAISLAVNAVKEFEQTIRNRIKNEAKSTVLERKRSRDGYAGTAPQIGY